jgi:hypothetical protein
MKPKSKQSAPETKKSNRMHLARSAAHFFYENAIPLRFFYENAIPLNDVSISSFSDMIAEIMKCLKQKSYLNACWLEMILASSLSQDAIRAAQR